MAKYKIGDILYDKITDSLWVVTLLYDEDLKEETLCIQLANSDCCEDLDFAKNFVKVGTITSNKNDKKCNES